MTTTTMPQAILSEKTQNQINTAQPMWKIVLTQFLEHRMAVVSTVIILTFLTIALSADLISRISGLDPNKQNVTARYLPPFSKAEMSSDQKELEIEKWTKENESLAQDLARALEDQKLASGHGIDAIFDIAAKSNSEMNDILSQLQNTTTQIELAKNSLKHLAKDFSSLHVFGTDEVGRDVLIRIIYGARVSMGVGIMVAIASALIGLLVGALAGFYGGLIDTVLMRLTDALLSLPLMPVLIVVSAVDLQKLPALKSLMNPENESIIKMFVILCLFSWMTVARLVRGSVLSLREREFVLASKTLGARDRTIILRHMFPNVMAPMLVSITLGVGESILFEAALSFLGLGIMPPTSSWGNMLTNAQEVIYKNPWLTILPGIMIFLTTVSFNFIGDGLQDAVDPKAIRR